MNLIAAFIVTFICAVLWLRMIDFLAIRGGISSKLSRKIIHIGTGPIFVLCWLFFPDIPASRFVAAIIPLFITIQFFLIGIGIIEDEASVDAMSRSGDRREILKGPLFYGVIFVIATILFWKDSPIGIIALMVLCGGDGFADVIGRRVPSRKLPWNHGKSIAGTVAMFFGGFVFSWLVVMLFNRAGLFSYTIGEITLNILLVSLVATFVEILPIQEYDNITVPLAAVLLAYFLFV